jgi:hypothetical protein
MAHQTRGVTVGFVSWLSGKFVFQCWCQLLRLFNVSDEWLRMERWWNDNYREQNLSQCHFVHQKSHTDWFEVEPVLARWETGDKQPDQWLEPVYCAGRFWFSFNFIVKFTSLVTNVCSCAVECFVTVLFLCFIKKTLFLCLTYKNIRAIVYLPTMTWRGIIYSRVLFYDGVTFSNIWL